MCRLKWLFLIVVGLFVAAQKTATSSLAASQETKEQKPSTKLLVPSDVIEAFEQTLKEALLIPQRIDDAFSRSKAFSDIAEAIARVGEKQKVVNIFNQALQAAQRIENTALRSSALSSVAVAMAKAGLHAQALQLAQRESIPPLALLCIIAAMVEEGLFDQALQVARRIKDTHFRSLAFSSIAKAVAKAGEKQKAVNIFNQALRVAQKMEPSVLLSIAAEMAEAGFF